jgi:hydroxymethylbilane synthase
MPAVLPEGLTIGAVLPREDPLDAVVLPRTAAEGAMSMDDLIATLGASPSFGTGSVRRVAQLTRLFPHARFAPIRGNLDTRLRKLDSAGAGSGGVAGSEQFDALVLAAAGLRRLGMAARISATLPSTACVPAPGQGIVAIEVRENDATARSAVHAIDDPRTHAALDAERALVEALGGGCQTPVGALASPLSDDGIEIVAVVVSLDGRRAIYGMGRGGRAEAAAVGARVGAQLLADGAGDILAAAQRARGSSQGMQP